jgi:hypothetical protein
MTDPLTQSLPQRIWLQVNTDGDAEDRSEPLSEANWGDLTWCHDSIGGQEVGYVREDLADGFLLLSLLADIRAAAGDREGRLMQAELVEHIRQLKARADEAEKLRAAFDRAETSYSGMLRADEKRLPGMTEYTRGWGGCLRAINAARAAKENA